jgi:hypothetical protein
MCTIVHRCTRQISSTSDLQKVLDRPTTDSTPVTLSLLILLGKTLNLKVKSSYL